jgi:hypothetical protein
MIFKKRLKPLTAVALSAVVISSLAAGCSAVKDAQNGLCCTAFVVGTDMTNADFGVDASIKGSFNAYAQATGDLSATASATLADVTTACQNIALDLGADPADSSLTGKTGSDLTKAWCVLAANSISADFGAKGTLAGKVSIDFTPPVCTASVQATADCEGNCDASASCDVKANPPTCDGGTLSVDCKGSCTAMGNVALECTGACDVDCTGSCQATGGVAVDCKGTCDGKCTAAAAGGSTTGNGIQADGSCDGQCDGTCTIDASAPKIKCAGTCDGHCGGTCKGTATASVKCNGSCDADYTPLKCEGGTLKASCMVDAHCEASCNASASAKAQCTPPSVDITAAINASANATAYTAAIDSLKTNLPNLLLTVQARGQLFLKSAGVAVTAGADVAASGGVNTAGGVCAVDISVAIVQAVTNMTDAVSAAGSVTAAVNVGT